MFKLFYLLIVTQGLVCKVLSSQTHGSVHQYVHVTGPKGYPTLPYTALVNPPSYKEQPPNHVIPANAIPCPGIPQTRPIIEDVKPSELPKRNDKNSFDTNLLNNLAIALQLLIVSNLLNMPQDGAQELPILNPELLMTHKQELPIMMGSKPELPIMMTSKPELPIMTAPNQELQQPFTIIYKPYDQAPVILTPYESSPYTIGYEKGPTYSEQSIPQSYYVKETLPNGNYLSSGFVESNILAPFGATKSTTTRKGMSLMSPYEALGTSLEPIGVTSKRDLQSPYASILADKELFSISDLF